MQGLISVLLSSLETGLIFAIMSMGVMLTYKTLRISDLSVEGTFPLGAFVLARLATMGLDPIPSIAISFIAGMLAGAVTYILFKKFKIDALLSGILTMTALYSINLRIGGKANVPLFEYESIFTILGGLPKAVILIILVLIVKVLLDKFFDTEKGYLLIATGDNENLVRSLGVNSNTYILLGLMLANGLTAMAGSVMAQYQGFADIQMGTSMIVTALASIIIGNTIFGEASDVRNTSRVILGAIIYRLISGLAIHFGLEPGDLKAITALIVVIFLVYNNLVLKRRGGLNDRN